jgi:hypothetical protein
LAVDEPSSSGAALVAEADACLSRGALQDACKTLERAFVGPDQAAFEAKLNPLLHAIAA